MYSPGLVGLGHIRRQLLIAQSLVEASPEMAILVIAETRQAGALSIPRGVDCLVLPALRKDVDGDITPRYLDVPTGDLVALRARTIHAAVSAFKPDAFIVDKLPRGAQCELDLTLDLLRERGIPCVLGLRDILDAPDTAARDWARTDDLQTIREHFDAVWIYGDPNVYDLVREYSLPLDVASMVRYVGYLDQRRRLELTDRSQDPFPGLQLPPGRLALCLVGGGQNGAALAETFAAAPLPENTNGIIVTGPFMDKEVRLRLRRTAETRARLRVLEFVQEPVVLIDRSDLIVASGGYNTVTEILSFQKRALLVPRADARREQWMRAERLARMGLVDVLHPADLSTSALGLWLERERRSGSPSRDLIDFGGLDRLPALLGDVLAANAATCNTFTL